MLQVTVYDKQGKSAGKLDLDSAIFGVVASPTVSVQAVKVQRANSRSSAAHTKTRGEVSGGGRKPWKQKGTGNARAGSNRSPLWIGGGVTFGPRSVRNYKLRLPQKMRTLAIKTVLSEIVQAKKLIVLKDLDLAKISTKALTAVLQSLPIETGKILIIVSVSNMNLELSAANLPYLKIIKINNLNVLDLVNFDWILITAEGVKKLQDSRSKNA